MRSELAFDAGGPGEFPADGLPEVALLGRSNVGKSSLVNKLLGRRRLARTSSTPGKTRRVHFYRVQDSIYLVDLPGYGYAAVARSERRTWRPMVESYLRGTREVLRGAVLLIDARRDPGVEERDLLAWLRAEGIPARVVLTKSDKLSQSRLRARLEAVRDQLDLDSTDVAAASARTGAGLPILVGWIEGWTGLRLRAPDGTPL